MKYAFTAQERMFISVVQEFRGLSDHIRAILAAARIPSSDSDPVGTCEDLEAASMQFYSVNRSALRALANCAAFLMHGYVHSDPRDARWLECVRDLSDVCSLVERVVAAKTRARDLRIEYDRRRRGLGTDKDKN